MSNWFDDAQRRSELKKQQEEQQQQQAYLESLRIVDALGVRERLEYIRQTKWERCGQVVPYQEEPKTHSVPDNSIPYGFYTFRSPSKVGLQLRFEYERLWCEHGKPAASATRIYPGDEWKFLRRSTETIALIILAVQYEGDGIIHVSFDGKLLSTPVSDFAALVQELDDAIYLYCQTSRSPLEVKATQDEKNRLEEIDCQKNEPRESRPRWKFW